MTDNKYPLMYLHNKTVFTKFIYSLPTGAPIAIDVKTL